MITKSDVQARFSALFDKEAELVVKSPGRINIIGEHTDYNEGFVLPTAIDKGIYVGIAKREDSVIRLYAEDFEEYYEVNIADIAPLKSGWPNYILGVVDQIQQRGLTVGGFDLYVTGDVPLGSGLSSSAALECASGFAINALFGLGLTRQDIAKIGQMSEHTYVGLKCGIMDQFASILSKDNYVVKLDCRDLAFEYVPLYLGEYELLLLNSNVKHELASSAYNDRRAACERGVAIVQEKYPEVNSLRDVSMSMLQELVKPVDEYVFIKCKFVIEENERVLQACDALKNKDIETLGTILFEAHEALSSEYEVSCDELDFLVGYAKEHDDVVGARMMGGGFGGCTVNFVKKGKSQDFIDGMVPLYKEKFNLDLLPIFVDAKGGTSII